MKSGKSVDVMPQGLSTNNGGKGPFIQNMHRKFDGWEVRPGFGQIAQFDSTLSTFKPNTEVGYTKQLGSYALTTSWGAVQIITVLVGYGNTSNTASYGRLINYYAVNIYDVSTGRRWEEILHEHAGDKPNAATPMPMWSGNYQSAANAQRSTTVVADPSATRLFFCKAANDTLLFGGPKIGFWAYVPAGFDKQVSRQTDGIRLYTDCIPYAESSKLLQITPSEGVYDGARSLDSASFPSTPASVARVNKRYVVASGRSIYISDDGLPGSIGSLNIVDVQIREEIVALGEFAGILLIFSVNETFAYRMGSGVNVASGDLRRLSSDIGCLGPQALVKADTGLVWCDRSGVFLFNGGSNFEPLADSIQDMFEPGGSLSLPLTSFWTNQTPSIAGTNQPRSFVHWGDPQTNVAFEQELGMLIITLPSQGSSLVLSRGAWSLFIYESVVNQYYTIEATAEITNPHITVSSGRVFAVCGPETKVFANLSSSASIVLLEMGRGGALDRTTLPSDDMRMFGGEYAEDVQNDKYVAIGRPTIHDQSIILPSKSSPETGDVYLFPVTVRPAVTDVATFVFQFEFNSTLWTPVFTNTTGQVAVMYPSERVFSMYGWGAGVPVSGSEVRCYLGMSVDETGNTIKAAFNGARGGIPTWSEKPNMTFNKSRNNPVMWIPFVRAGGGGPSTDLGITLNSALVNSVAYQLNWWKAPSINGLRKLENQDSSAVDWVLKSDQMEAGEGEQIRVRGLRLSVLSRGESTEKDVGTAWKDRMMNVSFQSDWRDWSGQISDMASYERRFGKNPLRSRFVPTGSTAYEGRTFDGSAKWTTAGGSDGDFLVDDEQRDKVSLSLSMRGERVTAMLFGHIRAVSARVVVTSMKAAVQVVGAARRWGR